MLLVDINGTEIGRILDAPVTPRASKTVRFKGTWYRVESVAYEVLAAFVQAVIVTLSPIYGEEREYRPTHLPAQKRSQRPAGTAQPGATSSGRSGRTGMGAASTPAGMRCARRSSPAKSSWASFPKTPS